MQTDWLKDKLVQNRAELVNRLEKISKHTQHRDEPLPADFAEQATELENQETLESMEQSLGATLAAIEHALKRIDKGLGGVCEVCSADISQPRLEALPHATLCPTCVVAQSPD